MDRLPIPWNGFLATTTISQESANPSYNAGARTLNTLARRSGDSTEPGGNLRWNFFLRGLTNASWEDILRKLAQFSRVETYCYNAEKKHL